MASKFNPTDRNVAQKEVERFFQTKLTPQKNFKKIFRDTNRYTYCILGGRDYWAGLTEKNLTFLQTETSKKILIFAKKEDHKIILFSGNLDILINNKDLLVRTKENIYEFNFKAQGHNVYIKEVQNFYLKKFSEINTQQSLPSEIKNNLVENLKKLTPYEKVKVINLISSYIQNKENNKLQ